TPFEKHAVNHFANHPEAAPISMDYRRPDGWGFRYAQALVLKQDCRACHAPPPGASPNAAFGIVSVDILSRVRENQLLLNRVFLLAAGMLAGTLAIITFYLITTRLILQPVRVLQETAEKVSEGDLNIRSDISTGDEFQQ